jgi:tetratricopeptide (TPR) repeat protein
MQNLTVLIKSLSTGEEKLVRHFYKLRDQGESRKRAELFDILKSGKAKDENHLAQLLGYTSCNTSYHNIKSRLKSDIICVLLMQESSCKFNTQYAQAMFNCRRALLTGEILLSRGVYQEGISLLKKAARIADKFELYAERILTEDALRNHHAGASDVEELNLGTAAIEDSYKLLGQMMISKKRLYETVFSEHELIDYNSDADKSGFIDELEKLENESDSSRVNFFSKLSRLNILHSRGDIKDAIQCAEELLDAVAKDPVVMSSANQAGIHLEIANMYLKTSEFAQTEFHAGQAALLFKPGMLNHMRATTLIFYAQTHSEKYTEAESTLKSVLASRCLREPAYEILRHRLFLVQAWFSLAFGKIEAAASCLKQCTELVKEKSQWTFGFALLECALLIEKNAFEAAIYKLDALRKSIARSKNDAGVRRALLIITILKHVIRANNDYVEAGKLASAELNQLSAPSSGAFWDPTGFEIIPFEKLFRNRARAVRLKAKSAG